MKIEIVRGGNTDQNVDAMVNAANSTLLGGGGVDGWPMDDAARIAVVMVHHIGAVPLVRFVLFGDAAFPAFQSAAGVLP